MDITNPAIITIGIFASVFIIIATLAVASGLLGANNKIIGKKLNRIKRRYGHNKNIVREQRSLFVKKETSLFDRFIPKPDELRRRLDKTGMNINFKKYIITTIILAVFSALLIMATTNMSLVTSLIIGLFIGLYLPHAFVNRAIKKRLGKFTGQFPEAIDLIVRGLRAGLPVTESIHAVAQEMQDPIATEFSRITDEIRLGKTMDEALWSTAKRLDTPDFKFFVISLSIQRETGGNLAETLTNLVTILRGRTRLKLKVRAMISEGKASAYIIGALPFLVGGILLMTNYDYISVMFTDPRGQMGLAGAGLWMGIGVFILSQMINFEV